MKIRTGQPNVKLTETEFKERYLQQFYDPTFSSAEEELKKITHIAWQNYSAGRKAPLTEKAGPKFKNPDYDLSVEWKKAHKTLNKLERDQKKSKKPVFLIICASPRNEHTCPSELSKTFRLSKMAEKKIHAEGFQTEFLDLSRLTSEYGKKIYPCKACVSTAMPLCHWPCSCYPNHSLGQTQDWMNEIYQMWVRAAGVMIITPVHWYQSPSPLKLMMDRLVCADGGNPDPTSTDGKDPKLAKQIELKGWDYPKHLKGRAFSVIVHGDTTGDENLRRSLVDWLHDLELIDSGPLATINRYIGYYEPYATSHDALDKDVQIKEEVELAARALVARVKQIKNGTFKPAERGLEEIRKK
ncbi:MAG: flavodoxin family protein [Bdellovibrio sp.]|nr:flavodoxin family protein [Bdellovibrio sp.]